MTFVMFEVNMLYSNWNVFCYSEDVYFHWMQTLLKELNAEYKSIELKSILLDLHTD